MLKSIKITNFHSIGVEQELDLFISKKDVLDNASHVFDDNNAVNLVTCIIGHNGSGKTNTLKALSFLIWWVQNSYSFKSDQAIPNETHKLWKEKNTEFELEFFEENELFLYKLVLNSGKVISEYYGRKASRAFSYIFKYQRNGNDWDFKSKFPLNKSDEERFKKFERKSILSSLIGTGYIDNINFFENVETNIGLYGYQPDNTISKFFDASERLYEDKSLRQKTLKFVENIDLGIQEFSFDDHVLRNVDNLDEEITKKTLKCTHISSIAKFNLELIEESNGTVQGVSLLSKLYPVLESGGLAIFDELEDGLHPFVLKKIINLFEDKAININQAQLIFTTHNHILLNDRTKTQIYLADKDKSNFETEIFRLDQVDGIRNDENFFQKYIIGTYGAVPKINWL